MSPLEAILRQRIAADGPVPLADYMALALGHPEHGYYMAREAIGAGGDFVTAPEISQVFGEIVGAWIAHGWELMGGPSPVRLVELGPGRGTLTADILRSVRVLPELAAAVEPHLVETSPRMRAAQRARLESVDRPIAWHDSLAAVPEGPMLLVANEFFDALPIRQLVRRKEGWRERCVGLGDDGRLAFVDGADVPETEIPSELRDATPGEIVETSPAARAVAAEMGARLAAYPGVALIVDYGYRDPAPGDSLQALKSKRPADPLAEPGTADLTAHVDFTALARAARSGGATAHGPITQSSFLTALGIGPRAERLRAGGASAGDLVLALERLTGAGGMGTLYKVLALTSPELATPPPFSTAIA